MSLSPIHKEGNGPRFNLW